MYLGSNGTTGRGDVCVGRGGYREGRIPCYLCFHFVLLRSISPGNLLRRCLCAGPGRNVSNVCTFDTGSTCLRLRPTRPSFQYRNPPSAALRVDLLVGSFKLRLDSLELRLGSFKLRSGFVESSSGTVTFFPGFIGVLLRCNHAIVSWRFYLSRSIMHVVGTAGACGSAGAGASTSL